MKSKIRLMLLSSLAVAFLVSAVYAPWSTLGTGYAITSDYHGIDVMPGTPITVTAGTLDTSVVQVTFRWHMPNDTSRWEETVAVSTNGTTGQWNNGTIALIRYAQSTRIPDVMGDWGVQAFFQDSTGREKSGLEDVIRIRATSFNVVPEIPLIGTIGATAAMFLGLGLYMTRRKK